MTRTFVAALCLAVLATAAWGQATAPLRAASAPKAEAKPAWAALTAGQQSALAPLRHQWPSIDADRKAKWLVVAQRFPGLPAEDRQRLQARMAEWASMTPAERGRARQNYQELRGLPATDRQSLWEAYRALPDEERRALALRAKSGVKTPDGHAPAAPAAAASAPVKPRVAVNQNPVTVKPVSPTVVQVKPGASTTLLTKTPAPPPHHQPGLPKITASKGFVDPATLLPARGPQGAATHAASASMPAADLRQ